MRLHICTRSILHQIREAVNFAPAASATLFGKSNLVGAKLRRRRSRAELSDGVLHVRRRLESAAEHGRTHRQSLVCPRESIPSAAFAKLLWNSSRSRSPGKTHPELPVLSPFFLRITIFIAYASEDEAEMKSTAPLYRGFVVIFPEASRDCNALLPTCVEIRRNNNSQL